MPTRFARFLACSLVATCLIRGASSAEAQTIAVSAGGTVSAVVAPNGKLTVPILVDLANAGTVDIAALQAALSWGTGQLTFDSIRVNAALGWGFASNVANAASGSVTFNTFNSSSLAATSAVANAYFTASAAAGGTRVFVNPTAAGNGLGNSILSALRPRALDVCVGALVKWGDVNANGVVDILDAQQITRFSAGLSVGNPTALAQRGDVNASGSVDIIDAQQIARFSVGLSAAPRINTDFIPVAAPTAVSMSPASAQFLTLGSSAQFVATPTAGGSNLSGCAGVTWSSSDPTVAVVNASGFVTAVGNGSVTITAQSGSATGQVPLTVTAVPIASIVVALGSPAIQVGTTTNATAVAFDAANNVLAGRPIAWSSSNNAVASVNAAGVVTGVSAGTATIFATSGGITGQTTVTVTAGVPVASITVALGSGTIQTSTTTTATATARDASNNIIAATVAWSSSNTGVATVNPTTGVVTAVGAGTANIIATANGVTGQATVTVVLAPVASVTVTLPSFVQIGATVSANAVARDAANNILAGATFSWTSSNSAVASVNPATGAITGVSTGTATIFATSGGVTGQATITSTTQPPIASVTVSFGASTISLGGTTTATAIARDASNTIISGVTFAWSSSAPSVASVNATTGVITGLASGSATITASAQGSTGSAQVTVGVPVASVAVSFSASPIAIGATANATGVTRDAAGNVLTGRVVAWSSSNNSVATINPTTGAISAVSPGTANIVATSEGVTGQASLTVTTVPITSVTVSLGAASIARGATTVATATAKDANNNTVSGATITWSSSNTAIATVNSSGVVTGVAVGTANIIGSAGGGVQNQQTVTVTQPPVSSVSVVLSVPTIQVSATATPTATAKDASNNTITGVTATWSSSNTAVATVNAAGVITAVAPGTANIVATMGGVTGQIAVTVILVTSNEPAGMTFVEQRAFNCAKPTACESNWIYEEGPPNSMTIVVDSAAPRSANNVAQMNYFTTLPGGSGPANAEYPVPATKRTRTIYISAWIKYSPNFQSHPTSINKEIHFFVNGTNKVFSMAYGNATATGPLLPAFGLQGLPVPYNDGRGHTAVSVDLLPNVTTKQVVRGQWMHHEYLISANTPGNADGSVEAWLDGTKVINFTGITFVTSTGQGTWDTIKWNPTWGGGGGTITAQFYMQMDNFYLSGK